MSTATFKKMSLALLAALLLAGCATEQVNWAARVGNYTYAQAAKDYATAYSKLRDATKHMDVIGNALADAIVDQFPDKF